MANSCNNMVKLLPHGQLMCVGILLPTLAAHGESPLTWGDDIPHSKRPRSDFDVSSGRDLPSYFGRDDERAANRFIGDSDSIGASYDRYTRSAQISLYGGGGSARPLSGGLSSQPIDDPRMIGIGGSNPVVTTKGHSMGLGGGRPLSPDASSTLFVEGLPANCTRREASHIFRPFVGYKEVRLVTKEPRRSGDDPLVVCFVDFVSPAHAATTMDALQGYKFDEHDRDSVSLQLQFARYPGARSGGGHRGKR